MNLFDLILKLAPIVRDVSNEFRDRRRKKPVEPEPEDLPAERDQPAEESTQRAPHREEPIGRGEMPRIQDLVCTTFLNASDDRNGATAEQPAYDWAARYYPGCGRSLFGCAVPMKAEQGDAVKMRRAGAGERDPGPWYVVPIVDKGPHHTTDDYLARGTRPAAEDEDGNHAGLDVTPPVMAKLLGITTEEAYQGEHTITVEAQLIRATPETRKLAARTPAWTAVEAARALPKPFPYAKETNAGELGCAQVITTALVNARLLKRVRLAVADARRDLEAAGWRKVPAGAALLPADVVVWGPTKTGTHKHIGMVTTPSPGPIVLHNSSAERRVVERPLTTVTRPVEVILRMP